MTLTTTHNRIEYVGNASTTVFPYDFLIPAATDLMVFHDDVVQTLGYTISGVGEASGGNVTYAVAPASDVAIVFLRVTDQTQQVNLIEGDRLPAEAVEGMFDKIYAVSQDLAERMDRTVRIPPTSEAADETVFLPDPADPANQNKALFIGADGQLETRAILSSDIASPISAQGDLIRGSSGATPERLPIGTAGQLLTVVTGQAAWATPSASGIQETLFNAKGDLLVGTAADTVGVLSSGTPASILIVDAGAPTGLRWAERSGLPYAAPWTFAEIAAPTTPSATELKVFVGAEFPFLPRLRQLDPSGQHALFLSSPTHLRFAGNPYKDVSTTSAATSIFASAPTILAGTLGSERGLRITLLGDVLQNSGATLRGFTLRFIYGSTTFATIETIGAYSQSATRRGWRAIARLEASGSPSVQFGQAEFVGANGVGILGTAVTSLGSGTHAPLSFHTTVTENSATDLVLNITIQPEVNSANLAVRVFSVRGEWL